MYAYLEIQAAKPNKTHLPIGNIIRNGVKIMQLKNNRNLLGIERGN